MASRVLPGRGEGGVGAHWNPVVHTRGARFTTDYFLASLRLA